MLQHIGGRVYLQDAEVILIHRQMKNTIKERFRLTGEEGKELLQMAADRTSIMLA